jgi:hypothetical protein
VAAESGEVRAQRMLRDAEGHERKAAGLRSAAARVARGNDGERQVAEVLDVLDGAGWVVLHDRYKAVGSPANLDHLVVGPPGVFVVDAKNWSGGHLTLDERGMAIRGYRRDEELRSAGANAALVAQRAEQVVAGVPVTGVLAFVQDVGLPGPVDHGGAVLLHADRLLVWLTSQPVALTPQQVHQLGSSLDAALPPRAGSSQPALLAQQAAQVGPGRRRSTRTPPRPAGPRAAPRPTPRAAGRAALLALLVLVGIALSPLLVRAVSPYVTSVLVSTVTPSAPACSPATTPCPLPTGTAPVLPGR